MGSWRTAGPAGSAQQAGTSVIAGRKLFNRSQNPSRMGPATTRSFSDVPANTPGKIFASSSFRSGLPVGNASRFTFSPRVPHNTIRESFPTVTPGRSFRGASADMTGRGMSKASATNLFSMRIASPPPELDGEELAKQVPDNPNRVGSVYADEYLSHLVPPELDDLQRRQFLCILDLRRLKYAANEIFVKKDWRVNIMNFAKEYEKSRSLIMLRYGLYEFKTVPASREVLKKWRQDNNVPDEDEEMEDDSTPKSNGASNFRASVKRRAEDDLTKDDSSKSFATSQNKRRVPDREPLTETAAPFSNAGVTPFPKKTKRGSEQMDQDDENQPNKMQKSKPSATLSLFEEVANNTPAKRVVSPPEPGPNSIGGDAAGSKPQPSPFAQPLGQSIFGNSKASGLGGNIFGHLSEQNTPMGSDDEEEEDDADGSDDDVEEVPPPAKKAPGEAPSTGSAASSLFGSKPSAPDSVFGQGPSLMGRTTKTSEAEADKPSENRSASPLKHSQPHDKTWNPNTPIKFGAAPAQSSTPMFGASTAQPNSLFSKPGDSPAFKFGSADTPKPKDAPSSGTQVKDFALETPKASASSWFGQTEKPSETTASLFGNKTNAPLFGKPEEHNQPDSTAAPSTPSLFGAKPQAANSTTPFGKPAETPATEAQSKPIFGLDTPATGTGTQSSGTSLFGMSNGKPANSLFGTTNGNKPSTTLFGAKSTTEEKKEESAAKRKKPDADAAVEPPSKKFTFGGDAPAFAEKLPPKTAAAADGATDAASVFGAASVGEKKYTFGVPAAAPAATAPAASAPAPAPAPTSLFGNSTATQAEPAKTQPSMFGSTSTPSTGFTFGSQSSTTPANPPSIFGTVNGNGSTPAQGSNFSFGSIASAAPAAPTGGSFTFNAGGGDSSFNNPFTSGNASQPPSFDFGTSSGASGAAPFQFGGGASAAPTSSFTFGAASQPTNNGPAPSNNMFGGAAPNGGSSLFNFGGASQQPSQPAPSGLFSGPPVNAAQGIFASQLAAPPAGSSTGTSK